MSTDTTTAAPVSIVANYATNDKTGQLKANLAPLPEAELSSGYDALRARALALGEEEPDSDLIDGAEAILVQARPTCRQIARDACQEALREQGLRRAALLRVTLRAMRVATSRSRIGGKRNP